MRSEIEPAVGVVYRQKYWIDRRRHGDFINAFEDRNPLHVDASFALSKGFSAVVVHGNFLCGFLSHFVGEVFPIVEVMIISQNISFHSPCYIDDEIILEAKILDYHDSVGIFNVFFQFERNALKVASGNLEILGRL